MDGRRRQAEPVTGGAKARPAAGPSGAPENPIARGIVITLSRRERVRMSFGRLARTMRRWLAPIQSWRVPRGAGTAAALTFILASASFGVVRGGHLPAVTTDLVAIRDATANALGFRITSIALAGHYELTREEILATAGITGRSSLLFLDAAETRARLKANPWIAEATVLKLYPGRLHITVGEREAFALWQKDGKVTVIAEDGTVVESYVARRFARLPLVVGVGAEIKAKEFLAQMDQFPLVRDQVRAYVLVAERRWNLKFKNGLDVRLPETGVGLALATLIRLDREKKLLSRDLAVIDLRLPDRVTVRLPDEVWAEREAQKKPPKKKGGSA
jgi:cell division protein FtsQ